MRGEADVLIVVYAGTSIGAPSDQYATSSGNVTGEPMILYAEKTIKTDSTQRVFNTALQALCHEYVHAYSNTEPALGNITDYYWDSSSDGHWWMGFSVMSYGHCMFPNRPLQLDPWAKLRLGWVNADVIEPDFYGAVTLPVVEKKYLGGKSKVALIPYSPSFTLDSSSLLNERYLIVENRRAYGFDQDVAANSNDEGLPASNGGFLVKIFLCMDVQRGAIDEPARMLSRVVNILSDSSLSKSGTRTAVRRAESTPSVVRIHPHPARDEM